MDDNAAELVYFQQPSKTLCISCTKKIEVRRDLGLTNHFSQLDSDRELDSGCYVLLLLSLKRLAYIHVQVFFLFPRDLTTQSLSYVSHYRSRSG